jgi:hypothetical protein
MMRRFFLSGLVVAALLAAAPGLQAFERVIRQNFPVAPGSHLKIDTHRGSLIISTGDVSFIRVEIHMQPGADKREEGDEILQHLRLDLNPESNGLSIFARNIAETRVRFVWEEKQKINLAYYILVPKDCSLDLRTQDGGITVGDLHSTVSAHANRGAIALKHIQGAVEAETDTAAIIVAHCDSDVTIKDNLGDIRLGTVDGVLTASNTSGDIEVQHAQGGAKLYANAGDITIGFAAGVTKDAEVKTNGGSIYVRLDPLTHCRIDASSNPLGKVTSKVAFKLTSGGNKTSALGGEMNGGGPLLGLHAHGGYVEINPPRI